MFLLIDIGNTKTKWMLRDNSDIYKQNSFLPELNAKLDFDTSKFNPNNKALDEILTPLIPYLTSEIFVGSGGGSAQPTEAKESTEGKDAKKEEKKEVYF